MIQFEITPPNNAMILVVGIGGGGNNAVNYMHRQGLNGVKYLICNTDAQVLDKSNVENKIQLGPNLTRGLGAGFNPKVGENATIESKEDVVNILKKDIKMVFITAGMGGGTGTGGAPVVAQICKELGILTVAVVTTPFSYEGRKRIQAANEGINELKKHVDIIIVVNNDKIRQHFGSLRVSEAFSKVDDVVANAILSITNVIYNTGTINVDFADVVTVMKNGGIAIMGVATERGENRAYKVAEEALNSPLLDSSDISGAQQILLNITTSPGQHEITSDEIEIIQKQILDQVGVDANLFLGLAHNENYDDEISITLIVTGFDNEASNHHASQEPEILSLQPKDDYAQAKTIQPKQNNQHIDTIREPESEPIDNTPLVEMHAEQDEVSLTELILQLDNEATEKQYVQYHETQKQDRAKQFEPYAGNQNLNTIHSQIFIQKDISEINFSVTKKSPDTEERNTYRIEKDNQATMSLNKNNEYDSIYDRKNLD